VVGSEKPIHISFVIPAYNAALFIEEAVVSIYNGNFEKGDEVVIVDDASSDDTATRLKALSKKYEDMNIITHKQNKGGGAARNAVVKKAKNELIFCLDADNVLAPKSVLKLKKALLNSDVSNVSFSELRYFKKNVSVIDHVWLLDKPRYIFNDFLATYKVPGASGNYLYTKAAWEKVGGYPEDAGALDAWGFGLKLAAAGFTTQVVPNTYYHHRLHTNSYWVRESKNKNMSATAFELLKPYVHRFSFRDRIWIRLHQKTWFDSIGKRSFTLQ
jgi:glycosyltransferase involved in cell wall biosynthesis